MGLGNSLNSLAGGYAQGQAQFAANEDARAKAAAAGAKAAQDAAEFRLKLAQHSQTLTNSAETEWNAITSALTDEKWDPAYLSVLLPRAANFDKTYGAVWGGGSAVKTIQDALHLNPVKADGALEKGQVGPQVEQPQVPSELFGFMSQDQKDAADEKAIKSRSAEAGRKIYTMASDYIANPNGGLVDEVTAYTRLHNLQSEFMSGKHGEFDPKVIDDAFDDVRENIAKAYLGVANQMGLGDKAKTQIEETGRQASTWITSLLQMDSKDGGMDMATMFATRTPLRLKMEQYAQSMAEQGMPLGQIKTRIASRFSNEVGGLELDITMAPGMGALTFAGAPAEARNAVDRYFDLNISPNEQRLETYWNPQTNEAWVVDPMSPQDSARVWPPANQGGSQSSGMFSADPNAARAPAGGAGNAPAVTTKPSEPMPGKAVLPGQTGKIAERASLAEQSAKVAADYAQTKAKIDADAQAKRDEGAAKVAMRLGGREWAMSNISDSMDPVQVESAIVKHIEDVLRQTGFQDLASGGFSQQAQRLYASVKDKVVPADTYQETAARILEAALGKAKK